MRAPKSVILSVVLYVWWSETQSFKNALFNKLRSTRYQCLWNTATTTTTRTQPSPPALWFETSNCFFVRFVGFFFFFFFLSLSSHSSNLFSSLTLKKNQLISYVSSNQISGGHSDSGRVDDAKRVRQGARLEGLVSLHNSGRGQGLLRPRPNLVDGPLQQDPAK